MAEPKYGEIYNTQDIQARTRQAYDRIGRAVQARRAEEQRRYEIIQEEKRRMWEEHQRYIDEMRGMGEEAEAKRAAQERTKKLSWLDDSAKGAQMGMAAGPWGALVGGIIGATKGQVEAYRQRRKEGGGGWESLYKTLAPWEKSQVPFMKESALTLEDMGKFGAGMYQSVKGRGPVTEGGEYSDLAKQAGMMGEGIPGPAYTGMPVYGEGTYGAGGLGPMPGYGSAATASGQLGTAAPAGTTSPGAPSLPSFGGTADLNDPSNWTGMNNPHEDIWSGKTPKSRGGGF